MKIEFLSSKKNISKVGLSGAILTGAITYFYSFFTNAFPSIQKKVIILQTETKQFQSTQKEIKTELKLLRKGQKEIYYLLLKK